MIPLARLTAEAVSIYLFCITVMVVAIAIGG